LANSDATSRMMWMLSASRRRRCDITVLLVDNFLYPESGL
jgi:hypothetical protein